MPKSISIILNKALHKISADDFEYRFTPDELLELMDALDEHSQWAMVKRIKNIIETHQQ